MTAIAVPSSPQGWRDWTDSIPLRKIPAKVNRNKSAANIILHNVFTDLGTLKTDEAEFTFVYTDVLALTPGSSVRLPLPDLASINLYARIVTADQPVTIELVTSSQRTAQVMLWATYIDQPVSVTLAGRPTPQLLDLGVKSGNVGVSIIASNGNLSITYIRDYDDQDLDSPTSDLSRMFATQLRIASTLFWIQPTIASSLTWHVVRATCQSYGCALLNVQASALQQQLNAAQLAGPGMSYAPVLKLDYYKSTINVVLDAGAAFQEQYDRFTDAEATVENQLKVWDSMMEQAQRTVAMQEQLATDARSKWDAAVEIVREAQNDMRRHQLTLQYASLEYKLGIEKWKKEQILKAVASILLAAITFAGAIGAMCVGDPGPAAAAPAAAAKAIQTVAAAASTGATAVKVITKDTMEKIGAVVEALSTMLESTVANVSTIANASGTSAGSLPPFPALPSGHEDLQALVAGAAWDKWTLDMEDQMAFSVSESIDGASAYLLELRKHAIDGRLTTQASAQAVRAGQEFVQVKLALQLAQADLTRLRKLRKDFSNQEGQLEEARLHFYDRLDAMRTSTLIELRNIIWACKFYTMQDSGVTLDPLKRMEEYKADMAQLVKEVERWNSGFASDKSPIRFKRDIDDPAFMGIGPGVIASLKESQTATFALAPARHPGPTVLPFPSGPFTGGSCFRVFGMRMYLVGAVPKARAISRDGTALVWITVSTSGVYEDIRGDGTVLGFSSLVQQRQFKYRVGADGRAVAGGIEVDTIIRMGQHMDPPPFTQWSITINDPGSLDLTNLTCIELEWEGQAYM
ncbi:hypothetical protein BD626DRAFT_390571 [Schizophyllum amplum]|uniref:Uncharacterized protein n=1 Tax=Schizophyllum amplum TaxID=97359 RepID=A0A550CXL5_9AGAR|nr:hypothetical protein BD626DRAFT_390571 [Auriculariopsis ampla]